MKTLPFIISFLIVTTCLRAQETVFADDFETGATQWTLTGDWGIASIYQHQGKHALADSPIGVYQANSVTTASMRNGVDLDQSGTVIDAVLTFWLKYDIETSFDYAYLELSTDDFESYITLDTYDGEAFDWQEMTYSLGGFVGQNNVKIRFRLETDPGKHLDGLYIDDVKITTSEEDISPPLILHQSPQHYRGSREAFVLTASIIDVSGLNSAELIYTVNGGEDQNITGVATEADNYQFTIPGQTAGDYIEYTIHAQDASANNYEAQSDTFCYIAGNYLAYDNAKVDFYTSAESGDGYAVKVSVGENNQLVYLLLRGYVDSESANSPIEIHVWDNDGGLPGQDVITPFMAEHEATLDNTTPMTRIDLRPYSGELSNLSGDYFIGFIVPEGVAHTTISDPGMFGRSYRYMDGEWQAYLGSNGYGDIHFRAITTKAVPPLIVHNGPFAYEPTGLDHTAEAAISSGYDLANISLTYTSDGSDPTSIAGELVEDLYQFTIPKPQAGAWVEYTITAQDSKGQSSTSEKYEYIAGEHLRYENEAVQELTYLNVGASVPVNRVAVRTTITPDQAIVAALIGNVYNQALIFPISFHIWADNDGKPGADIMPPIAIRPAYDPNGYISFTRLDLRPYFYQLSEIEGDCFFGISSNKEVANVLMAQPAQGGRSFYYYSNQWYLNPSGDFYVRAVVDDFHSSIETKKQNRQLDIYPNPATKLIYVESRGFDAETYNIKNLLGESLLQSDCTSDKQTIDVDNLSPGLYILELKNANGKYLTRKFIKQ